MRWALLLVLLCWCAPHITLPSEGLENLGSSAGYNIASELLINSINFSVDPCEDFYEFSCGNWIAKHPIPKDKASYSQFEMLLDKVQAQMRDIFESNETFGSKSMNAVKYIYKRCMDKDELNRIGARRVIERLRSFGVWPILEGDENWREENFDLTSLLIHLKQMRDFNVFVKFGIGPDYKNASRYLIKFYQDDPSGTLEEYILGRGVERGIHFEEFSKFLNLKHLIEDATRMLKAAKKFYISMVELFQRDGDLPINRTKVEKDVEEIMDLEMKLKRWFEDATRMLKAAKKYYISMVELFQKDSYLPINRTKVEKDVEEILDLEMKMAKMLVPNEDRKNYTKYYHLSHLSDMNKLVPLVDWTRLLLAVAPFASHQYLKSNPEILIADIDYLKGIRKLLQSTNARIITNFIFMRFASRYERELGEKYEDIVQELEKVTFGKQQKEPRWMDCTRRTMQLLKYATSAIYVKKAFDQSSKNFTIEMIDDLLKSFREILGANGWMDDRTKAAALDKANQLLSQVAYPEFILDNEKLDQYYDGLDVNDTDSYSEMLEKVERQKIEFWFKMLTKPASHSDLESSSATVVPIYIPTTNSLRIPAAILQAPLFHHTFPRALNYGGLGALIGHEITHAFDDVGRQFDDNGNVREWWDPNTKKQFEDRAQCIINQYEEIEIPGTALKINGKLSQGEIIADNGGVKQAYKAYKAYLQKFGREEERIKCVEQFNNEQMFFLGYAMVRCEHFTRDAMFFRLIQDPHPPERYEVNQVLANQPEFAAAFKCKVGSAMNPAKRCVVW